VTASQHRSCKGLSPRKALFVSGFVFSVDPMQTISWRRIARIGVALILVALAVHRFFQTSGEDGSGSMTVEPKSAAVPPPGYGLLAERLQALAQRQPTPEEWEEERQYDREQALALAPDLHDPGAEKRIETAEQLGAFPSEEAEVLLIETLAGDPDPDVRVAAVQSLENFEHLRDETIAGLLGALEDENEEVRMSALTLLETRVSNEARSSVRYKKIVTGLKKKAVSRRTPAGTRRAIRAFLEDQAS
jgi:hypothetical protein